MRRSRLLVIVAGCTIVLSMPPLYAELQGQEQYQDDSDETIIDRALHVCKVALVHMIESNTFLRENKVQSISIIAFCAYIIKMLRDIHKEENRKPIRNFPLQNVSQPSEPATKEKVGLATLPSLASSFDQPLLNTTSKDFVFKPIPIKKKAAKRYSWIYQLQVAAQETFTCGFHAVKNLFGLLKIAHNPSSLPEVVQSLQDQYLVESFIEYSKQRLIAARRKEVKEAYLGSFASHPEYLKICEEQYNDKAWIHPNQLTPEQRARIYKAVLISHPEYLKICKEIYGDDVLIHPDRLTEEQLSRINKADPILPTFEQFKATLMTSAEVAQELETELTNDQIELLINASKDFYADLPPHNRYICSTIKELKEKLKTINNNTDGLFGFVVMDEGQHWMAVVVKIEKDKHIQLTRSSYLIADSLSSRYPELVAANEETINNPRLEHPIVECIIAVLEPASLKKYHKSAEDVQLLATPSPRSLQRHKSEPSIKKPLTSIPEGKEEA